MAGEFAGPEGLDEKCPHIHGSACFPVFFPVSRSYDDNGNFPGFRFFPQTAAELETVYFRHNDIGDDKIRFNTPCQDDALFTVTGRKAVIA